MWRSFSTRSTGFKEVSKVKEVNSQMVTNEVMKTFLSAPTKQAVFLKQTLYLPIAEHMKRTRWSFY